METIEEVKARQAQELAEREEAHRLHDLLDWKPKRIMFADRPEPWVTYEPVSYAEALDILDMLSPDLAKFALAKRTCLAIKPKVLMGADDKAEATPDTYCVNLNSEKYEGLDPNVEIVFWIALGGKILRVSLHLQDAVTNRLLAPDIRVVRDYGGRKTGVSTHPNSACKNHHLKEISWWTSGKESARYSHLFGLNYMDDLEQIGEEIGVLS